MKASSTYIVNPVIAIEDFGDRSLVLHCEDLRLTELNATARDILRRLDGESPLSGIAELMASDYDQPLEVVLADLLEIMEQMAALDLVILSESHQDDRPLSGPAHD
ncbi:MAG: PqqD family protein [Anaerolineales bacterium]